MIGRNSFEKQKMTHLTGKVILITGAAGGIGSAISLAYAAVGATVIVGYNGNFEKAQQLCESLPGDGHVTKHVPILNSSVLNSLADEIKQEMGRLDILVNNAGVTKVVPHQDLDGLQDEDIDRILTTNFRGSFACIRAFQNLLAKSGEGLVINISSIAGSTAVGSSVAYCASKAAINSMTMSLGRALAPNIRVVAVAPGWVAGEYASRADPAYMQEQIDKTPLGRIANASDVANTVVALSTTVTFNTGCIIPVDGGRPLT
jgi:3-oxoacyl-[acyl-carrier protein] reductase